MSELQVIELGAVSEVVVHSLRDQFRGIFGRPLFQIDTQRRRLVRRGLLRPTNDEELVQIMELQLNAVGAFQVGRMKRSNRDLQWGLTSGRSGWR